MPAATTGLDRPDWIDAEAVSSAVLWRESGVTALPLNTTYIDVRRWDCIAITFYTFASTAFTFVQLQWSNDAAGTDLMGVRSWATDGNAPIIDQVSVEAAFVRITIQQTAPGNDNIFFVCRGRLGRLVSGQGYFSVASQFAEQVCNIPFQVIGAGAGISVSANFVQRGWGHLFLESDSATAVVIVQALLAAGTYSNSFAGLSTVPGAQSRLTQRIAIPSGRCRMTLSNFGGAPITAGAALAIGPTP